MITALHNLYVQAVCFQSISYWFWLFLDNTGFEILQLVLFKQVLT